MRVRILGCSGGIGLRLRTTSLLVDDDVLIDCGTGVGDLSLAEMQRLRHVFLTHSHLDHIGFLPLLLDAAFEQFRAQPLQLHCRPETFAALKTHIFNWTIWPDFFALPDEAGAAVRFEPMRPGESRVLGNRVVAMAGVNHSVPAAAYRVGNARAALAFSGDTTANDGLWAVLNRHERLDLLVLECAYGEDDRELSRRAKHYCPSLLAADLGKLRHRPRICISHLKPGSEAAILGELATALPAHQLHRLSEGEVFEL